MKNALLATVLAFSFSPAFAADHDPKAIISLLKDSKVSLLEAVNYAEKSSGATTSAKFEVEDGKLMLSVYTVPEGLGVEPEKATLTELSGAAVDGLSALKAEVFTDKEHIARASVHMTLFQLSKMTLRQVIERAQSQQYGEAIDVRNPVVRNRRPVADVVIVDEKNKPVTVTVDLLSGETAILQK